MLWQARCGVALVSALSIVACAPAQRSRANAEPGTRPSTPQPPPAVATAVPVQASPAASSEPAPATPEQKRVPSSHRALPESCSTERVAGDPQRGPRSKCTSDTHCRRGKNGRCGPQSYEGRYPDVCYYDECYVDDDCAAGMTCACGSGSATGPHRCVPSNCRTDSDCDPSAPFCSPKLGCSGVTGWYCHTAQDECLDDADCKQGYPSKCEFAGTRWVCGTGPNCI